MSNEYVVGVDLGGTKIHTALADLNGKVLVEIRVPTIAEEGQEKVIGRIVNTVNKVCQEAGVKGRLQAVGVGAPALVDHQQGIVFFAPNLGWHDVSLKGILENILQMPVKIDNDVNLAALGEYIYGFGKGTTDLVYIAVGTGIGGGLILDGQIYRGANGSAGEIGHIIVEPEGALCSCGNRGCLEALASGTAIAREARELIKRGKGNGILLASEGKQQDITARTVAKAAVAGDPEAQSILADAARALGIGVVSVINLLSPALVVLGGGVMEIGQPIFEIVKDEIKRRSFKILSGKVEIVLAKLGGKAGVLGAVALALGKAEKI